MTNNTMSNIKHLESWNASRKNIYRVYYRYNPYGLEFEDFYQMCAVCFWGHLALKYDYETCLNYSMLAYKRVMIKYLYRRKNHNLKVYAVENIDNYTSCENEIDIDFSIKLKPHIKEVATLVSQGYETDEICKITNKTVNTIYSYVQDLKKQYADYLGITDYQGKNKRSFTRKRTDKEIESWQKGTARLKRFRELKSLEKSLQMKEKLSQC